MEPEANATINTRQFDVLAAGNTVLEDVNPFVETGVYVVRLQNSLRLQPPWNWAATALDQSGHPVRHRDHASQSTGVSDPRFSIDFLWMPDSPGTQCH